MRQFLRYLLKYLGSASIAHVARRPQLEGVSTPSPDLLGTAKVGCDIAGCFSSRTRCPVLRIHLPESHIKTASGVLVNSISVTSTLVADDALALSLVPFRKAGTPSSNILVIWAGAARARAAIVAWAVAPASPSSTHCGIFEVTLVDHFRGAHRDDKKEESHLK